MRFIDDNLPATEKVFDTRVRFVGDRVAAVAVTSREIAKKALSLIKVEYEELPAVFVVEEAASEKAYPIYKGGNIIEELHKSCGNLTTGFEKADFVLEHRVETPILHHGAIEPYITVVDWTDKELVVRGPQQGVYSA